MGPRTSSSTGARFSPWAHVLGLALLSGLLSYFFNRQVLDGIVHVQDELAYRWQGQVFAGLELSAASSSFDDVFVFCFQSLLGDRVYSIFPPGWPWLLALGHWLGLEAILPMLLSGLNVVLLFALARHISSAGSSSAAPAERGEGSPLIVQSVEDYRLVPLTAVLLALLSPAWWVMGATFMAHTWSLLLAQLFWLGSWRVWKTRSMRWAGIAGLSCGWLAATRPLDAVAACAPYLLAMSVCVLRRSLSWRLLAPLAVLAALPVTALLFHNHALTGGSLSFPQNQYFAAPPAGPLSSQARNDHEEPETSRYRSSSTCNALGFGSDRGCGQSYGDFGHTPYKAWQNGSANLSAFDRNLFGGAGSLLLMLPGMWLWRRKLLYFVPALLAFPILYSLYWYHGIAYGARFWHPLLSPVLLLCAVGIAGASSWISRWLKKRGNQTRAELWMSLLLVLIATRVTTYLPGLFKEYGQSYWCVDDRVRALAQPLVQKPALVLIGHTGVLIQMPGLSSYPGQPVRCNNYLRTQGSLQHNDPAFQNDVLFGYLPSARERVLELQAAMPERHLYLYVQDLSTRTEELLEMKEEGLVPRYSGRVERLIGAPEITRD